jgi:hypothetical protein
MEEGAEKYIPWNWTEETEDWREAYTNAMLRHAHKFADPNEPDEDVGTEEVRGSGLNHLCHVGACAVIMLWKMGIGYVVPNAAKRNDLEPPEVDDDFELPLL